MNPRFALPAVLLIACSSAEEGPVHSLATKPFPCCEFMTEEEARTEVCVFCSKDHEIASESWSCTCGMWAVVPVFGKQAVSNEKVSRAWNAQAAAEACWGELRVRIERMGGKPGNRISATCNGVYVPGDGD